jgi:hypothetical protein
VVERVDHLQIETCSNTLGDLRDLCDGEIEVPPRQTAKRAISATLIAEQRSAEGIRHGCGISERIRETPVCAVGKTSEAAAANPNPPGTLGAQSVIASAVSGQITNRVAKIAGISHFSVDPTLGGSGQTPGASVTVQQRVTSKVFVTFSTDLTSTQRNVMQLEYQPNRKTKISGTRDQNGGFAFDTRFQKSW